MKLLNKGIGMYRVFKGLVFIVLLSAYNVKAQEVLTVDQAIELALKNNYDVQLAKNDAEIARLANTPGNAGMLPRLSATLTDNFSYSHLDQKLANGTETHKDGVTANTVVPSLNFSWTLFDGLKMFATKGKLKTLQEIGQLNVKDTLQTIVAQVSDAYYDVVAAQQQLRSINEAIELYQLSAKIAETQFQVGLMPKTVMLQAQVDLNSYRSAALNQRNLIDQKKATLNLLLVRPAETDFTVLDSIPFELEPKLITPTELESKNFQTQVAAKYVDVSKYVKREVFSQVLPNLTVGGGTSNAGYGFSRSLSSAGFSLYNQSYGPNVGFTLYIPLFNGLVYLNQIKSSKISIVNSEFKYQKVVMQNKINYYNALKNFQTAKAALKLEEENINLAKENNDIAMERFRVAQSTALELRQAQQSYVDALTRLVNARFNAKTAETELMRIQGDLVK